MAARVRKSYRVNIGPAWCKACGICIAFCPKKVLAADGDGKATVVRQEDCIGCGLCERRCPDFAVTVREEGEADR